jgi:hypothetical protein
VEPATSSALNRYAWAIALALLAFHAVLAWLARAPGIRTGHDDAIYVLLGRALRGFQYRELFRVDLPVHIMYPPGYPAMLAVWSAIGGDRFNWLVLVSIACSVGTLALTYSALSRLWNPRVALCCLAALTTNPALIEFAGMLASEAPFTFFQTLGLWALSYATASPGLAVIAGAAGIAGALTRSAGVTLIAAIGLYWLWQRRFRALVLYALVVIVTVGSWLMWTINAPAPEQVPGKSYIADAAVRPPGTSMVTAIADRLKGKVPYVQELYWRLPVPSIQGTPVDNLLALPAVLVGISVGLVGLLFRWPIAFLYLVAYGGLLMVWPWRLGRFLVPVLPVVVPTMILGLARLVRQFRPGWETRAALAVSAALLVSGIVPVWSVVQRQQACDPGASVPSRPCLNDDQASFFAATDYINRTTAPDALFLTGKAATVHYYTGRRVVSTATALANRPEEFVGFLRDKGVDYILLLAVMPYGEGTSGFGAISFGEMVKATCGQLHLEASFPPSSFLFRLPAADERPDSAAACAAADTYLQAWKAARLKDDP